MSSGLSAKDEMPARDPEVSKCQKMEVLYQLLRTWLNFQDPILVILCAFFHPGESMVRLVTERVPCYAGILPTVYLKARARRACVDYDAKTTGIEPCIGGCWRWHGWADGSWAPLWPG